MDELKKLLGEELFKQVSEKLGSKKILLQEKDGDFVPRSRIDEEKAKLEPLQNKVTELENELKTSKETVTKLENEKKVGNQSTEEKITELNAKIEKLENDGKEKDKKLALERKVGVLRGQLTEAKVNPKYMDDVVRRFEKDGTLEHLEVENGKIKNFDELHKPIYENNPEMYGDFVIEGGQPGGGSGSGKDFGETESMKRYKELMGKEKPSPKELQELNDLAIKIKDEQNKKET